MSLDKADEEDGKDDYFLEMLLPRSCIFSLKNWRKDMLDTVTVIYCICDEVWNAFGLKDAP
jgi:hypothetical protein